MNRYSSSSPSSSRMPIVSDDTPSSPQPHKRRRRKAAYSTTASSLSSSSRCHSPARSSTMDETATTTASTRHVAPPRSERFRSRIPHTTSFFTIICILSIFLPIALAAPPCVRFADYDSINQMFIDGGPGTKVLLCPNKLYRLSGSIIFTAADQELATYGYPTGSERAMLRVEGKQTSTAVQGDCRRCARVSIKSLIIDGNRKKLGRMGDIDSATGLIVLGGNEGQSVKNCWIKNPRGFTAVHFREGDKLSCTGAMVDKNEIGPVGEEYDPAVDGDDPEMSPLGRPLADGVSMACRDSFVRDNTFYDNTDASIVLYCSPGTLVHANHIFARSLSAMAGILLVDSTPFDGDYTGVTVKANIIDAASRAIRVGIGIGATVWSDDAETIIKGGTVINNGLKGRHMGYGIAAAGLDGWTVKGNWDEANHEGQKSARCFDEPVNPDPVGFLYNLETIKDSTFQPGFVDHEFQYVVCIDGVYDESNPPKHDLPPLPHDIEGDNEAPIGNDDTERDADPAKGGEGKPAPVKAKKQKPAEAPRGDASSNNDASSLDADPDLDSRSDSEANAPAGFSTGSEVMDDILEHSQQRMLEAIDHLHRRVDQLAANVKVDTKGDKGGSKDKVAEKLDPALSTHLEKMQRRVEHLESSQKALIESAMAMRSSVQSWDQEMTTIGEWQYDILLDVRHKLELHLTIPDPNSDDDLDLDLDFDDNDERDTEIISPRVGSSSDADTESDKGHERDGEAHAHHNIEKAGLRDRSNRARLKDGSTEGLDHATGKGTTKEKGKGKGQVGGVRGDGDGENSTLSWWIKVLLFQGIVGSGIWAVKRWWKRRRIHSKLL